MLKKAIAFVAVAAACTGLFVAMHRESRADAAGGNCYSDSAGPSTPTLCN
jgi:hypothetical protein